MTNIILYYRGTISVLATQAVIAKSVSNHLSKIAIDYTLTTFPKYKMGNNNWVIMGNKNGL